MARQAINIAIAKEQLTRINAFLSEPLVLIGGLAVNQYYKPRDSFDIDLVCSYEQSRRIVEELFPSNRWESRDANDDEYRPDFVLFEKVQHIEVKFGPKITERGAYTGISWEDIKRDAKPFEYQKSELPKILVPTSATLCVMKFLSYLGRADSQLEKREQDLKDFMNLTNDKAFSSDGFYQLLERWQIRERFAGFVSTLSNNRDHSEIYQRSSVARLATLATAPTTAERPSSQIATRAASSDPQQAGPAVGVPSAKMQLNADAASAPLKDPTPSNLNVPDQNIRNVPESSPRSRTLGDLWQVAFGSKKRAKATDALTLLSQNLGDRLANQLTDLQDAFLDYEADNTGLSPFQRRENLIIAGPTSAGKTTISDAFLFSTAVQGVNRPCAIYIAPTRALAQAKYREFSEMLRGSDYGDRLVLSTGEDTSKDWRLPKGHFSIAFLVYEKANILFSRPGRILRKLGCLVVDEIHMLDDLDRGPILDLKFPISPPPNSGDKPHDH
jgi:hypothetical protein